MNHSTIVAGRNVQQVMVLHYFVAACSFLRTSDKRQEQKGNRDDENEGGRDEEGDYLFLVDLAFKNSSSWLSYSGPNTSPKVKQDCQESGVCVRPLIHSLRLSYATIMLSTLYSVIRRDMLLS